MSLPSLWRPASASVPRPVEPAQSVDPSSYTEPSFWEKLAGSARVAGREVVEKALWLHFAARSPDTPTWARATIYGALAYFILPTDAIPDLIPGVGYMDDLGALLAAVATVTSHITPEVKSQAAEQMARWFESAPDTATAPTAAESATGG